MLKIVLAEINHDNGTDYQQSDVYFCFKRETIVNEAEQATIELTKAQRRAAEIGDLLRKKEVMHYRAYWQGHICRGR